MNRNATFLLVMALLSLAGAMFVWWNESEKTENGAAMTQPIFTDLFEVLEADDISIHSPQKTFRMTRGENGWYADSNTGKKISIVFVEDFFNSLTGMMSGEVVSQNAENLTQYGLSESSAVNVELWSGGVRKFAFAVGNSGPMSESSYVRILPGDDVFLVRTDIRTVVRRDESDVLDLSVWKVVPEEVRAVHILSFQEKLQTFFSRTSTGDVYRLKDQGNTGTNQNKFIKFVSLVSSLQASEISDEQNFESAGLEKEYARIVLRLADGKDRVLLFGKSVDDGRGRLVAEEGTKTVYVVSEALVQTSLLLRSSDFLFDSSSF